MCSKSVGQCLFNNGKLNTFPKAQILFLFSFGFWDRSHYAAGLKLTLQTRLAWTL